ncbi:MAG: hypothetical protein COY69_01580 [Candidatus Magasanikbacteria bacterium CG_4_10_14_0_8_um_filter_32_14]|uniref:Uncharacterized protein n=1 Tax=Candidatus Magasanikbacteria bacterium CG_4_10_14_0_8_um_filter_32_14 TaxID=1974640 RepID=A0A2M7R9L1_9BACT|nr:MAG: hypothetical protein COY69_01580 [Candidatus Magasanikbacteria bacterium CG_4_10_14_0_8_um_filter_32_14]
MLSANVEAIVAALLLGAILNIIPIVGTILWIIIVFAVVYDTCTDSTVASKRKEEPRICEVRKYEINYTDVDQVFDYPKTEIRIVRR